MVANARSAQSTTRTVVINNSGNTNTKKKLIIRNFSARTILAKLKTSNDVSGAISLSNNRLRLSAGSVLSLEMGVDRQKMQHSKGKTLTISGYLTAAESYDAEQLELWSRTDGCERKHQLAFELQLKLSGDFAADEIVVDIPVDVVLIDAVPFATSGIDVSDTITCRHLEEDTTTARPFGSKTNLLLQRKFPATPKLGGQQSGSNSFVPQLTAELFTKVLNEIDTFIFDADGVLWLGEEVIPGSPGLIDFLLKKEKTVIVLTNNTTKSRDNFHTKIAKLGFDKKLESSLVNPAIVCADNLHQTGIKKQVYLIGGHGIQDELTRLGIKYFGPGPEPHDVSDGSSYIFDMKYDVPLNEVGAVVVGYEKHFNYQKLMKASNYLKDPECLFLATNEDETCPGPDICLLIPDAGPMVAAISCATGRKPKTMGKPNTPAFEYIAKRWKINPERTLMTGDRTNTDVKFGRDHGLRTLLVLSGVHQLTDIEENLKNCRHDMVPDFYATNLGSLVPTSKDHKLPELVPKSTNDKLPEPVSISTDGKLLELSLTL